MNARRRTDRAFTLIEMLVVLALSGIVLVPLASWFTNVLGTQQGLFDRNQDTASAGLLSRYFPADVASSNRVWTSAGQTAPYPGTAGDCLGSDASLGGGGTVVGTFVTYGNGATGPGSRPERTVYATRGSELWRRQCPEGSVSDTETTATTLGHQVQSATVTCSVNCGTVSITVVGTAPNSTVTTSATRRPDPLDLPPPSNSPPTAVLTATPANGNRPLTVQLSAVGSADPDPGDPITFTWVFGDGTSSADPNPTQAHTYLYGGPAPQASFTALLTVTDSHGASNTAAVPITVKDNPPVAVVAASDSTPGRGQAVNFSSAGSGDPDSGPALGFSWAFAGASPATSTAANPQGVTWATIGAHAVTLTVTDADGVSTTTSVVITVVDKPPVARITAPAEGATLARGVPVVFDGSSSEGANLTYSWNWGSGPTSTGATPSHTFPAALPPGTVTVTLTITDGDGRQSTATRNVSITQAAPTVSITVTPPVFRGLPATFTAVAADPDGTIASTAWTFTGGGPSVATSGATTVPVTFSALGASTVTVTVKDNDGNPASQTVVVQINNRPPTVVLTRTPPTGTAPFSMAFSSAGSADPDGFIPISGYLWTYQYSNGSTFATSNAPAESRIITPGNYQVTLGVTDNDGGTASATQTFSVPGQLPTPGGLVRTGPETYSWDPVWGAESYEVAIHYYGFACDVYATPSTVIAPDHSGVSANPCPLSPLTLVQVRAVAAGHPASEWSPQVNVR